MLPSEGSGSPSNSRETHPDDLDLEITQGINEENHDNEIDSRKVSRKRKFASLRELLSESSEHSNSSNHSFRKRQTTSRRIPDESSRIRSELTPISRRVDDSSFWNLSEGNHSERNDVHSDRFLRNVLSNSDQKNRRLNTNRLPSSPDSFIDSEDIRSFDQFEDVGDDLSNPRQHNLPTARRLFGNQTIKRRKLDIGHRDSTDSYVIMREIRRLQHTTHKLIPQLAFARFVKDISDRTSEELGHEYRFKWTTESLEALHEAAEAHIINVLERSNLCASHAKRITLTQKDVQLSRRLSEKDVCPTWIQALKPSDELK